MTINYLDLQAKASSLIKALGMPVAITRDGTKVASTYGIFTSDERANETKSRSSTLAQTEQGNSTMILASFGNKSLSVGDIVTVNKSMYTVTKVEVNRPTATTLYYKVSLT